MLFKIKGYGKKQFNKKLIMMNFRKCSIQPSGSAIAPCLHCDFELAGHTVAIINAAVPPTAALKITAHPRHTGSTAFFRIKK